MAKRFAGFTPEQLGKIIPEMQGMQSDEQARYLASQPGAAARVGRMAETAQKRIGMAYGGMVTKQGFAEGGLSSKVDSAQATVAEKRNALLTAQQALAAAPDDQGAKASVDAAQVALTNAEASLSTAMQNLQADTTPAEMTASAMTDPMSMVETAEVATPTDEAKAEGTVAEGTGQVGGITEATATTAETATPVTTPTITPAATMDVETVTPAVEDTIGKLTAATGKPSAEALAEAATMKPGDLASLGLTVEQINEAQKVVAPAPRKVEEGELIEGATVDMERVKTETNFEAATGAPSTDATVQGQLSGLMEQFEGSEPPAWAAGAMRAAASQMAARGLSASSMAGQAAIQAAMESALPIAVQDAQTSATFEMQNLSNRQQSAMFAAEKRAEFLNLEFTQEFQSRVANASKISDIANMNFTSEQQIALENARMAQTVDLANLSAVNAKVMADAASMSQLDMANLSNRQQSAVQVANAFLNMDMQNLENEQQTSVFKTQQAVNAMLSDQAAVNAASQFNATSENQTNQFFASLSSQVAQFNVDQANGMQRFNAGEANALAQFNAVQQNARDQFNAQNHLVVAQANAQWFQNITTAENAAQNQANRDAVLAGNNLTMTAYNNIVQRERDLLAWAWQSAENAKEIDGNIAIAKIKATPEDSSSSFLSSAAGKFLGAIATNAANAIFNK